MEVKTNLKDERIYELEKELVDYSRYILILDIQYDPLNHI